MNRNERGGTQIAQMRSEKLSRVIPLLFFWIRFLDRFCKPQKATDAAGGVFFLGRRSEGGISAASMVGY